MDSERLFFEPADAKDFDLTSLIHQFEEDSAIRDGIVRKVVAYQESDSDVILAVGFGTKGQDIYSMAWFSCLLASGAQADDLSEESAMFRIAGDVCEEQHREWLQQHFNPHEGWLV